jgi:hypothetical protein
MANGAGPPGQKLSPPQPQGIPIVPKQTTYPSANAEVQALDGGGRVLIFATPVEILIFPLSPQAAKTIGQSLTAPSVEVPGPQL